VPLLALQQARQQPVAAASFLNGNAVPPGRRLA
jgi:hypothetical protein